MRLTNGKSISRIILPVWHALGGGEVRNGRAQAFWRRGDGWSVALDSKRGFWYDFVTASGGGVIALVETVRQFTRSDALRWLEAEGFIESVRLSPIDQAAYRERRDEARSIAMDAINWRRAIVPELEAKKAAALEAGDEEVHAHAARRLYLIACCDPETALAEFGKHRQEDPAEVRRLIAAGDADAREVDTLAALCVLVIEQAEAQREAA